MGFMIGNFILRQLSPCKAICSHKKDDLPPHNDNFRYSYPHSNALLHSFLRLKCTIVYQNLCKW